jgi:hypothetical protein
MYLQKTLNYVFQTKDYELARGLSLTFVVLTLAVAPRFREKHVYVVTSYRLNRQPTKPPPCLTFCPAKAFKEVGSVTGLGEKNRHWRKRLFLRGCLGWGANLGPLDFIYFLIFHHFNA